MMRKTKKHFSKILLWLLASAIMTSCSYTKHVPQGQYLLDKVNIKVHDNNDIKSKDLVNYLRQSPNHEVLGGLKLSLAFYNISGKDSTKLFNKWMRNIGQAPVIYDSSLVVASEAQLHRALVNMGYMESVVTSDTIINVKKRRVSVNYDVTPNVPHYISSISYNIPNYTLRNVILKDSGEFVLKKDMLFNRNDLELEREQITDRLRQNGYYAFNKEYITFTADTAAGSKAVDLTLNTMPPYKSETMKYYDKHKPFYVRNVVIVTHYDPLVMHDINSYKAQDTLIYSGKKVLFGDSRHYIRGSVLDDCCYIEPGKLYNSANVNKTYQALGRLGILKFINIDLQPVGEIDGKIWLDAYVLLTEGKSQSVSLSLEGTNSEGDLGFGIGASYQHRNLQRGSEVLNARFRTSYESLSGDLSGLINNNYSEYVGQVGITYPKFKAPFLKKSFKQKILATTELATSFSYQARPEYTRIIAGASWRYNWNEMNNLTRHLIDVLDINYVYLPDSRINFLDDIKNPLLRYSYENHFIMRLGYSYYHTNKKAATLFGTPNQSSIYTIRAAAETAGNLLYGISNLTGANREEGAYKVFGIRYSQYAKFNVDYSLSHSFNTRSALAFHVGFGAGIPYGNSTIMPFEKRFYSGGANSVRGWGVRTLGPGKFNGQNYVNNFIYQCGDIRLDLSLEARIKLFWVLELGAFVDAGNIWTIKDYEDQPGGVFKINKFYEQIAAAYGLGLRMDFKYFLLRLDVGMKAFNPAQGQERWPLFNPNWGRDSAIHFSVGYPF